MIDDRLMRQAMAAGGHATKRATVEEGLRLLVRMKRQRSARSLRGRVAWTGDLDAMRLDHGAR